jgi:hypothetical protein
VIQAILVQPEASLFKIAAVYLGDATQWTRLALINNIKDPFSFGAPTILSVPKVSLGTH